MTRKESRITIAALIKMLNAYPDKSELYFGGLEFYRLKDRGAYVQVEFSQSVYQDDQGLVIIENHK